MNLSKLKKEFFTLDSKIEFYLPTMTIDHNPIAPEVLADTRNRVASVLSKSFGGCTATNAVGFYENKALGTTQIEHVEILYSYAKSIGDEEIENMLCLAKNVRNALAQESIMLVVNGTAIFI